MKSISLYAYISQTAEKNPHTVCLLRCNKEGDIEEVISYKELKERMEVLASWISSRGVKAKDVLGIALPNSPEFLILSWTAWSMGIVTMPLDIKKDTLEQHIYKLKVSNTKLLIAKEGIFDGKGKIKVGETTSLVEIDSFYGNRKKSTAFFKEDMSHRAIILFTSGTTAHPKGAKLSLENLVVNANSIKEWFKISKDDRFMVVLPLHHINSTSFCLATLLAGGSIALVPGYSNSRFWQQIADTSSTFTSIVPSICFDQLSRKKEFEMVENKLKINRIQIGSAPVVVSDVKKFMKMYDIPMYQGYGQTETALRVTGVPLDLDKTTYEKLVDNNSIGKPMGWAEVQIMDDNGKFLGEGEEGELAVKGKAVMEGYLGSEDSFRNGYFLTGDIGYYKKINNERYFFLKGRKKEIIIKGGINISPVAVEDGLKRVSRDIDQTYVIGYPDPRFGEEVSAVISWRRGVEEEEAKLRLKDRLYHGVESISLYESPRLITSIDAKDLPLTSTGKVQRSFLKTKFPPAKFESIYLIAKTRSHSFIKLTANSPYLRDAFMLYNYCWYPLTLEMNQFKSLVSEQDVIVAIDKNNKVQGLVSTIRTDASERDLCSTTYTKLVGGKGIKNVNGRNIVCVSICSSNYKQENIKRVKKINPTKEKVVSYLESGKDSVYQFHLKPKGGLRKGAGLVCLLPKGRPQDQMSLGYNMLLKYPPLTKKIVISENSSIASQLIEVVMLLAKALGLGTVYAFSRPAGLAKYLQRED